MIHSAIDRAFVKPVKNSEYSSIMARGPLLDRVYSLRYKSYSEEGYIDKCVSRKFMDEFDALPNCTSYLTYCGRQLIGSLRSCVYRPGDGSYIPVMDVYREELKHCANFNAPMIEANKFVIDPQFQSRGGVEARFNMFRNIVEEAIVEEAKSILIAVRPEHIKFYRILFFSPVSDEKSYPHLSFKNGVVAMHRYGRTNRPSME